MITQQDLNELVDCSDPQTFKQKLVEFFHPRLKTVFDTQELIDLIKVNIDIDSQNSQDWQQLLDEVKNITLTTDSPLLRSISSNDPSSFKQQLSTIYHDWEIHPDDLTVNDQSLIQICLQKPINFHFIKTLLSPPFKCSVNQVDLHGRQLSHLAALFNQSCHIFSEIIRHDEYPILKSIQRMDDIGWTPLCYAANPDNFDNLDSQLQQNKAQLVHQCLTFYERYNINLHPTEHLQLIRFLNTTYPDPQDIPVLNALKLAYFFVKFNHPYAHSQFISSELDEHEDAFFRPITLNWEYQRLNTLIPNLSQAIIDNRFDHVENKLINSNYQAPANKDYSEQALFLLNHAARQGRYAMIGLLKQTLDVSIDQNPNKNNDPILTGIQYNNPKVVQALLTYPTLERSLLVNSNYLLEALTDQERYQQPDSHIKQEWQSLRELCQSYNIDYQYDCLMEAIKESQVRAFENTFNWLIDLQDKQQTLDIFQKRYGLPLAHHIASMNQPDILNYLAYNQPDTLIERDRHGQTALHKATSHNAEDSVEQLLVKTELTPFDADNNNNSPIYLTQNTNLIKRFYAYNTQAEAEHYDKIISYLYELTQRTNNDHKLGTLTKSRNNFILFRQIAMGLTSQTEDTLAFLYRYRSNFHINEVADPNKNSVLHIAVLNSAPSELVERLITKHQANPFQYNNWDETPLSLSLMSNNYQHIQIMLKPYQHKGLSEKQRAHLQDLSNIAHSNKAYKIGDFLDNQLGNSTSFKLTNAPEPICGKRQRATTGVAQNDQACKKKQRHLQETPIKLSELCNLYKPENEQSLTTNESTQPQTSPELSFSTISSKHN